MPRTAKSKDSYGDMIEFKAKHSEWIIFSSIYWAIYLLLVGLMLLYYGVHSTPVSLLVVGGFALTLLAAMLIIFGAAETLHYKLMRKYV